MYRPSITRQKIQTLFIYMARLRCFGIWITKMTVMDKDHFLWNASIAAFNIFFVNLILVLMQSYYCHKCNVIFHRLIMRTEYVHNTWSFGHDAFWFIYEFHCIKFHIKCWQYYALNAEMCFFVHCKNNVKIWWFLRLINYFIDTMKWNNVCTIHRVPMTNK